MEPHIGSTVRLVAIDEDHQHLKLILTSLENLPLEIHTATVSQMGFDLVQAQRPQIVIVDLAMPGLGGMQMLEKIVEMDPATNVLLMTKHYSAESAVEAIAKGACDYLTKPIAAHTLRQKIEELLSEARYRQRTLQLEKELVETLQFEGIIGRNLHMLELFGKISRIAPHYRTVLLTGETGTGKELAAKALHRRSPVAQGPFVARNCSAIVESLFETELFGHAKGSFSGATHDRAGIFEQANGGTVMLDEIGDLPLPMQAKLLRVLQNHEIQRVGCGKTRKVNVRVIAATHRDIHTMVRRGEFREDLFYRLAMMELRMPVLRERLDDLPFLIRHFVHAFALQYNKTIRGLTRRAQMVLSRYAWPGNVRELENTIGYACMMTQKDMIDINDLPEQKLPIGAMLSLQPKAEESFCSLEEIERRYVREVVNQTGNKARAAEILGISRTTLYHLLESKHEDDMIPN
jgi:two-component system, NtrC family, response regulator HydG